MKVEIKKATPQDGDQLFELVQILATSFKPEKSAFLKSLETLSDDNSVLLNVAVTDQEFVGYCLAFDHETFYANGRVTLLEEIIVKENIRKNGVGRKLMESVKQWAETRNSRLISVATRRAREFYEALGYEESATYFRKIL